MDISKEPKRRRARGSGSVYRKGRVWWIAYYGPDGRRHAESSESTRKGDAERLLQRRVGAREHNLPVIPRAEQLTFHEAAQDVINDFVANGKRSLAVVRRRIEKHLSPTFGGRSASLASSTRSAWAVIRVSHRWMSASCAARRSVTCRRSWSVMACPHPPHSGMYGTTQQSTGLLRQSA